MIKKIVNILFNFVSSIIKFIANIINKSFKKTLGYATSVRKFKGLESKVCIILNISGFDVSKSPSILFTGVTRSQYNLFLLFDENEKDQWGKYLR